MSIPVVISIVLLIVLLMVGIPVPSSFFACTLFLILTCDYAPSFLVPYAYSKTSSYVLLAMPLFIIAGGVIEKSELGAHLVNFVNLFVGRIKGSLGIVAADSLLGEVTAEMAAAVAGSEAVKVLIPLNRCDTLVAGVSSLSTAELLEDAMEKISALLI